MATDVGNVRNILRIIIITLLVSGCASQHYSKVKPGELKGKLLVQWYDYDEFIFIPDKDNPLRFIRNNKTEIIPGKIYTDGGSIPRPLWVVRSYSPWGFAPAGAGPANRRARPANSS